MRKTYLLGLFLSASLLAACNGNKEAATAETATPAPSTSVASTTPTPTSGPKSAQTSVDAQGSTGGAQKAQAASGKLTAQAGISGGSGSMRTYYTEIRSTSRVSTPGVPDTVTTTPSGLSAGYLFNGSQVKTRMNLPGSMFADNRPRIALYDSAQQAARVVFADNMQIDTDTDADQLASFLNTATAAAPKDGQPVYAARNGSQFSSGLSAQGLSTQNAVINVNGANVSVVQGNRTLSLPNGQQQQTTSLDPNLGYVVQATSRETTSEAVQQNTSNFTYQDIPGVSGAKWPSHIHSDSSLTATDVNITSSGSQDVDFTNGQANTLPDSYFSVGGL